MLGAKQFPWRLELLYQATVERVSCYLYLLTHPYG
jgi:hypothetical protein